MGGDRSLSVVASMPHASRAAPGCARAMLAIGYAVASWVVASVTVACGPASNGPDADASLDARASRWTGTGRWACPDDWVPAAIGGCGPAVLLCAPDGGAVDHACDQIDITRARVVRTDDGGTANAFVRDPDGGLNGAWPPAAWRPDASAARDLDWAPDAGVPSCPAGWTMRDDRTCDPRADAPCDPGSEALPARRCTPTAARDCPSGVYADPGPAAVGANIVHVDAMANPLVADGSLTRPYADLTTAIARAGTGGFVLVARGTYVEALTIESDVHVIGACAHGVRLQTRAAGSGTAAPTVRVRGATARLELRGVSIAGVGHGVEVSAGGQATIRACAIDGASVRAVLATGAGSTVDLADSVVSHTTADPTDDYGRGLQAEFGARARVERTVFAANRSITMIALDRAHVSVRDCVVRATMVGRINEGLAVAAARGALVEIDESWFDRNAGTVFRSDDPGTEILVRDCTTDGPDVPVPRPAAQGVTVRSGANVSLARVGLRGAMGAGVQAASPGSTASVRDATIVNVRRDGAGSGGNGMLAHSGATLTAMGVRLRNVPGVGVLSGVSGDAVSSNGTVDLTDFDAAGVADTAIVSGGGAVRARRVRVAEYGIRGIGAYVRGGEIRIEDGLIGWPAADTVDGGAAAALNGARVELVGVVARETARTALTAAFGGSMRLEGVWIDRVRAGMKGGFGRGIEVTAGSRLVAYDVRVERATNAAVVALGAAADLVIDRVLVVDTQFDVGRRAAYGIAVAAGGHAAVGHAALVGNGTVGLGVAAARCEVTDSMVADTRAAPAGGPGRGVEVAAGGVLRAARVWIARPTEAALLAIGDAAEVDLRDVMVDDVRASSRGLGYAIAALSGAALRADRVGVRSARAAAFVTTSAGATSGTNPPPTSMQLRHTFVQSTRSGTITFDTMDGVDHASGRPVAYGLHVGPECELSAMFTVLDGGGFGFFNAGGLLAIEHAVIARQLDAFGARANDSMQAVTRLDEVFATGNASDEFIVDATLPTSAGLERPTPICTTGPGCM